MREILSYLTLRTVIVFGSTAFSLMAVMLFLNIITVDDIVKILNLSPEGANALRVVVSRVQEVSNNILEIITQLLNKLFSWAGVDVDLGKIKVNANQTIGGTGAEIPSVDPGANPDAPTHPPLNTLTPSQPVTEPAQN